LATGIPGPIFPGGLSHLCRKNFLSAPEKTAMLTCKITLPDSPYRVTISNNPRFRPLYLARQNEFRFFRILNTKKYFSSFLAAVFCPKNLAFARKIIARVWGRRLQPPSLYVYVFGSFQYNIAYCQFWWCNMLCECIGRITV